MADTEKKPLIFSPADLAAIQVLKDQLRADISRLEQPAEDSSASAPEYVSDSGDAQPKADQPLTTPNPTNPQEGTPDLVAAVDTSTAGLVSATTPDKLLVTLLAGLRGVDLADSLAGAVSMVSSADDTIRTPGVLSDSQRQMATNSLADTLRQLEADLAANPNRYSEDDRRKLTLLFARYSVLPPPAAPAPIGMGPAEAGIQEHVLAVKLRGPMHCGF